MHPIQNAPTRHRAWVGLRRLRGPPGCESGGRQTPQVERYGWVGWIGPVRIIRVGNWWIPRLRFGRES